MAGATYGPWHRWFAWFPVRTLQHGWRWLRQVERRQVDPAPVPIYTRRTEPFSWYHRPEPKREVMGYLKRPSSWQYRPTPGDRREVEE